MNRQQIKQLALGAGMIVLAVVLPMLLPGVFDGINRSVLDVQYRVRGESKIDSSIVILYLNNDDIASLGGLPLKRSYYALVLKALHELGAKAVGVDIAFTEPDHEHPEYDQLLVSTVKQSGNIVLSGYFRSISADEPSLSHRLPEKFVYNQPGTGEFLKGKEPDLPFPELLGNASGFGHTNVTDNNEIPLCIQEGTNLVPAFSLELLRVDKGVDRSKIRFEANELLVDNGVGVTIPLSNHGTVSLNYSGGLSSLNVIPLVRFLQSYDMMRARATSRMPVENIKGKIVLFGIIAEGRSSFVSTPFTPQFPSIGLHATTLDNALKGNFLRKSPRWMDSVVVLLVGFLTMALFFTRRELIGIGGVALIIIVLVFASYILFSSGSYVVPIAQPVFAAILVAASMLAFGHQLIRGEVTTLSEEKKMISAVLHEKELTLRGLEQQLADSQRRHAEGHSIELREEIRKYKQEILTLKTQHEDLQPFTPVAETQKGSRQEFNGIIYDSAGPMSGVVEFVKKIADSDATVLLLGESGTGKEVVVRAIHQHSKRSANPFVAVNCGALTETLLESELFGHEKGSFTGAMKEKPGRFELAYGGTIFLDEIAETSEAFQVKLLRVLQEGTFERVGGTETKKTNVRVIAATNRTIKQAVEEKRLREDLYYRLNVFTIQLPPLRERLADIPLLAEYFANLEHSGMGISANVMKCLQEYYWKGNVRELQSVIKRAVLLAKSDERDMIRTKDLPEEISAAASSSIDIEERIIESLRDKKFSRSAISETADDLGGLNRGTVAEYFRGYCFKVFAEMGWNVISAVDAIAGSPDPSIKEKVERKLLEYLGNGIELVDHSRALNEVQAASKPKYKNLPQRYHAILDEIIVSYYKNEWIFTNERPSKENLIA